MLFKRVINLFSTHYSMLTCLRHTLVITYANYALMDLVKLLLDSRGKSARSCCRRENTFIYLKRSI